MADLLREAGLPAPVLRQQNGFVTLTFALQSAGGSGTTPGETPEAILAWLDQKPSATVPQSQFVIPGHLPTISRYFAML